MWRGAGGIGFDVSEYLVHDGHSPTLDLELREEWRRIPLSCGGGRAQTGGFTAGARKGHPSATQARSPAKGWGKTTADPIARSSR